MRHLCAGILLTGALACWAGTPRVSPPAMVGLAVDPIAGRLVAIEGVAGRLSLGRSVWDGPVEAVWPAPSRALVRSAGGWQLLEFNEDMVVSRVLDLGERDWTAPVWNAHGSAWLACSESTERCGVYRAEDGVQSREIRAAAGLRALSLSNGGSQALLRQGSRAVLWNGNEELVPVAEGEGLFAAFSPDGSRLAVINDAGNLTLADGQAVSTSQVEAPADAVGLVWSGDSMLTVHRSGEIRRWSERGEAIAALLCECQPAGAWVAGQGFVRLHDSLKQISYFLEFGRGEGAFTVLPASVSEVQ
jgi:hypothetical protein